jgi:DNA-binding FadR family transcriptional regulator
MVDDMTLSRLQHEPAGVGTRSVYDELRAQIVDGIITPGTHLVEGALAKSFGVSRTPIREALSQLAYEGLLERYDRAMRVRVLRAEDVLEIYEVRIVLERAAACAAAERRTDLDLGRLSRTLAEMQALGADEKPAITRLWWRPWKASTFASWDSRPPPSTTRNAGRFFWRNAPTCSTRSGSAMSSERGRPRRSK